MSRAVLAPAHKCCIQPACAPQEMLSDALAAFLKVLDGVSLEDLVRPKATPVIAVAGGDRCIACPREGEDVAVGVDPALAQGAACCFD